MSTMTMRLLELPNEMLEYISSFLDAKSLSVFGQACKALHDVSTIDALWQHLCQKDYDVTDNEGWNLTFRHIYTRILHPYPILGFKRLALRPFGGLLHLTWAESEIQVRRFYPGWSYDLNLTMEPAFSLTWNHQADRLDAKCVHNPEKPAPALILKDGSYFVFQCQEEDCFRYHKKHARQAQLRGQSDSRVPEGFKDHPGAFKSFTFSSGYSCPILPVDSRPIQEHDHFPVTPGFYRGDYGGHGVEIIQIRLSQSNSFLLEGLKISGDPNVPAGNASIMAYLDKPILLTEEDQQLTQEMVEADKLRGPGEYANVLNMDRRKEMWNQPFVLPSNCFERDANPPSVCLERYLGHGRIAGHNFHNSSLSPIHFIKFDDDTFGVMWLDLSSFMMMQRQKDILKQEPQADADREKSK